MSTSDLLHCTSNALRRALAHSSPAREARERRMCAHVCVRAASPWCVPCWRSTRCYGSLALPLVLLGLLCPFTSLWVPVACSACTPAFTIDGARAGPQGEQPPCPGLPLLVHFLSGSPCLAADKALCQLARPQLPRRTVHGPQMVAGDDHHRVDSRLKHTRWACAYPRFRLAHTCPNFQGVFASYGGRGLARARSGDCW